MALENRFVLIYMSIREHLQLALDAGWLVNLQPSLPSIPHQRMIFVARTLYSELEYELNDASSAVRTAELFSTFDVFLSGKPISIGGRDDKYAYIKQLEPTTEEVWEIRSIQPRPSIRVFGRFAACDVFIACNKGLRTQLGGFGSREFQKAMSYCKIEWRKCLQSWPPHSGKRPNDYVSENLRDLSSL
jgi:hypothetical protein